MSQPKRPGKGKGGGPTFPGSIATQAQVVCDELVQIELLRTKCAFQQELHEHPDDHVFGNLKDDGEDLSYADYRKQLDAFEQRLRDIAAPAAMRLAEKKLAEALSQAETS